MMLYPIRNVSKELDRALSEKQKLLMEIEEQKAAMEEFDTIEAKLKLEAQRKEDEIKVILTLESTLTEILSIEIFTNFLLTSSLTYLCVLHMYHHG